MIEVNALIEEAKATKAKCYIHFRKLQLPLVIQVITDSGFKNKEDPGKPRQGMGIRIAHDGKVPGGPGNPILAKTFRTKRAVRSTLGAETLAQVAGFDVGSKVRIEWTCMNHDKPTTSGETSHEWLTEKLPMDTFTDCNSLWGIRQGHRLPIETNLMPDIVQLRAASDEGRVRRSYWVPTADTCVDGLTKSMVRTALQAFMRGEWETSGEYALAPDIATVASLYGVWVNSEEDEGKPLPSAFFGIGFSPVRGLTDDSGMNAISR